MAPNQRAVCYKLANLLLDTGGNSDALPLFEQAIRFDPSYDKAWDRIRALGHGVRGTRAGLNG